MPRWTPPAEEEAPARQRLSAENRRAAIIDGGARRCLRATASAGTGTSDIAAAAGLLRADDLQALRLQAGALRSRARGLHAPHARALRGRHGGGGDLFTAYLRFVRGLMGDPRVAEVARLRYLALTLTGEPEIRAGLSQMMSAWHSGVRAAVEDGRANGRIRSDADVASVSMLFLGLGLAAGFVGADRRRGGARELPAALRRARRPTYTDSRGDRMNANRLERANHKWWTLAAMCFALFMIMLDNTVVNVALPSIQRVAQDDAREPRVDDQRLLPVVRGAHPARRQARRPLRPQEDLPRRPRNLHALVRRLRALDERHAD